MARTATLSNVDGSNNTSTPTEDDHNHHRSATGLRSEHGHHIGSIAPMAKHSGSSVAIFFNGLFSTILGISTLGASITFNYVLSNASGSSTLEGPAEGTGGGPHFSAATVQLFLSVSWLLFLLELAVASAGSTFLTFFCAHWEKDWDGLHGRTSQVTVHWYAVVMSAVMGLLVIGAFALLCLVVVAYSRVVGLIALVSTCLFGVLITVAIIMQIPWPCSWREVAEEKVAEKEGRAATV